MKKIINSEYSPFFLAGLALVVICAWCSMGSLFYDEHFQVLEFCNYKLGKAVPNSYSLPWEFYDKIRASLLPDIAYGFAKIMDWCGLYNPFILAFLLRLLTGVSGWFITCRLCLFFLPKLKSPQGKHLFIVMSLFLWFVPFLAVRYTVENISGIILLYGIYSILSIDDKTPNVLWRYIIAGLFFGISFFIRVQVTFAIAGFVAWLIVINKMKLKYLFVISLSMVVAIGINVLLDYWFYGEWVFSPLNYYYKNIIEHAASDLNTSPWWFYFSEFSSNVIPPLSWLLLLMFMVGVYKNLKHPFVWLILPFLLAHCVIAHKEFRFLFPVTFIFIYIAVLGFDYLLFRQPAIKGKKTPVKSEPVKEFYQKIHKYVYIVLAIMGIPLLIFRTVAPVQISMYYNKYLYNNAPAKNIPLFYIPNRTNDMYYDLNTSFYKNPGLNTVLVDSIQQLGSYLRNNKPASALFFTTLSFSASGNVTDEGNLVWNGYKIKTAYCFFPKWVLNTNFDNWKDKTPVFRVYQFTPVDSATSFDVNKLLKDSNTFHSWDAVNSLLSSANNSIQNDKVTDAEKILTTIAEKTRGAGIPHLHNYLGMVYMKENKAKDAEIEFNTEIAMNLQKEEAFLNLGVLYFQAKDYENAVKAMNNVLLINPNNADALNNLGVYLLYFKKDYNQAISYFVKVLNLDLDYRQAYINFVICAQNFNRKDVIVKYQRILLDNRNDPYTWVMVDKGMSLSEIQAKGINMSANLLKQVNAMM